MEKNTWANDVFLAITNLGGEACLSDIYAEVERIRKNRGSSWNEIKDTAAVIRKEIETRSKDSSVYKGKEDLYISKYGKGKGIWALKSNNNTVNIFSEKDVNELSDADIVKIEGNLIEKKVLSYKRNSDVVKSVKERDHYRCLGCGFSYNEKIVEVHHLIPLNVSKETVIKTDNLVTLCPNCHSLAHLLLKEDFNLYSKRDDLIKKLQEINLNFSENKND